MPNAIVTGATQGIGKAVVEKLLSEGFSIAVCARTQADLDMVEQQWKGQYPGAQIIVYRADLTQKDELNAFAKHVLTHFETIDILVHSAGIFLPGKLMEEPEGHLESIMDVNLYSVYHLTRAVIHAVNRNGKGHIFNMASVASLKAYPSGGSYGISKYALLGFSENLREELKSENIRVTALCLGATYTRSWMGAGIDEERMMKATDVAEMLWTAYNISALTDVETIVMRPAKGDL